MNALEFNAAINGLVNSALQQGCPPANLVLVLELLKCDIIRNIQDEARERASKIVPARVVPRINPNGDHP